MKRTLIAVAVAPDGTLWRGHFGIAPEFHLYAPDGTPVEKRSNPYGATAGEKHQHHDDPQLIINLLPECRVFIARRMGDRSKHNLAEKFGIVPVITTEDTPKAAIEHFLHSQS